MLSNVVLSGVADVARLSIDYNNNLLQVQDYDWVDSSQVTRDGQGVPSGVPERRDNATREQSSTTIRRGYERQTIVRNATLVSESFDS